MTCLRSGQMLFQALEILCHHQCDNNSQDLSIAAQQPKGSGMDAHGSHTVHVDGIEEQLEL